MVSNIRCKCIETKSSLEVVYYISAHSQMNTHYNLIILVKRDRRINIPIQKEFLSTTYNLFLRSVVICLYFVKKICQKKLYI